MDTTNPGTADFAARARNLFVRVPECAPDFITGLHQLAPGPLDASEIMSGAAEELIRPKSDDPCSEVGLPPFTEVRNALSVAELNWQVGQLMPRLANHPAWIRGLIHRMIRIAFIPAQVVTMFQRRYNAAQLRAGCSLLNQAVSAEQRLLYLEEELARIKQLSDFGAGQSATKNLSPEADTRAGIGEPTRFGTGFSKHNPEAPTTQPTQYEHRITWHSVANVTGGYAGSSRELMKALERNRVYVDYKYVYGPGTPNPGIEPKECDDGAVLRIQSRPPTDESIQVVYAQGDVFHRNTGRYKIGFTMLETDRIPGEWARQANQMDEVWVPSEFNVETFRESGVKRPIYVMPLGIDPKQFHPGLPSYPIIGQYTFLSIYEWGERKAPELLLRAFNDEFRRCENVVLLCKTFCSNSNVDVRREIKSLGLSREGGRIVLSLNHIIPSNQLGILYRSADCFVLPTRGEGWGLPILEAMACGLPVIATNWSAHTQFFNDSNGYPVEVESLVPAVARSEYYRNFRWAQPSYEHLRARMRYVYENREAAQAMGRHASEDVLAKWTWDNSAKTIANRLGGIGVPARESIAA